MATDRDHQQHSRASNTRWQTTMVAALATKPLADRLLIRLMELVDTNPDGAAGACTPKISQATLAAMVGVSRENVNRALASLTARGLIRRDGGWYVVVDEEGLRREVTKDWPQVVRRDRRIEPTQS